MQLKMDKKVIAETAQIAHDLLDRQVIGLAEQERQIENIVFDFLHTKDGKCCLLEGERHCGRESVLRKVLRKYKIPVRVVNAGYVADDPSYQNELAREDDDDYSVFLVRDTDKLLTPQQQKFLYMMVDKATHFSWLVFFSVSGQDFAQHLQKQATSRIPKVQVSFYATHDYDEYCNAMRQFLVPIGTECAENKEYGQIVKCLNFQEWLRPIFDTSTRPYVVLKQLASQILMMFEHPFGEKKEWTADEVSRMLKKTVECFLPSYNKEVLILKGQTMRAQCVFLCVWKLLHKKETDGPLTAPVTSYRTVFLEFKKLVNQYFTTLDVSSDVIVFRELDHLVEMGLLKADESANVTNTSFRKVWLQLNEKTVQDTISELNLPKTVQDFFIAISA